MDMSYLKDMPIAVLGGGAVGKTMAADCALAGKEVRIWDQPAFRKDATSSTLKRPVSR